jgi:hypothetical protein
LTKDQHLTAIFALEFGLSPESLWPKASNRWDGDCHLYGVVRHHDIGMHDEHHVR